MLNIATSSNWKLSLSFTLQTCISIPISFQPQTATNKPPFSSHYIYVHDFELNADSQEKSIGMLLKFLPYIFVYLEKTFTQISLNWMVFKMQKKIVFISTVNIVITDLYLTIRQIFVRPPHCLRVTLNKNAKKSHFNQLEIIPQFYTSNLYIHPNQVSIPNCGKQTTL